MIKLEENTKVNFAIVKAGTKSLSTGKRAGSITSVDWRGSDIEQRNVSMNEFVAKLISNLRMQDVYAILVKGQGEAQCYEKPLWRSAGDVDLYLSKENYDKAKEYLVPLATEVGVEDKKRLHLEMNQESWVVE